MKSKIDKLIESGILVPVPDSASTRIVIPCFLVDTLERAPAAGVAQPPSISAATSSTWDMVAAEAGVVSKTIKQRLVWDASDANRNCVALPYTSKPGAAYFNAMNLQPGHHIAALDCKDFFHSIRLVHAEVAFCCDRSLGQGTPELFCFSRCFFGWAVSPAICSTCSAALVAFTKKQGVPSVRAWMDDIQPADKSSDLCTEAVAIVRRTMKAMGLTESVSKY